MKVNKLNLIKNGKNSRKIYQVNQSIENNNTKCNIIKIFKYRTLI